MHFLAGASHGSDVLTLFLSSKVTENPAREINITWNFADKVISLILGEMTRNFITFGNPSLLLFQWPIYKANNSENAIKIGFNGLQEVPYHKERRQFWQRWSCQLNDISGFDLIL
uniref:Carboxylesterase type B domain-containing protein n=1 Tax=Romanomermis culicivorax TaxID=13658 RepID=A0A915HKN6_ROMCU